LLTSTDFQGRPTDDTGIRLASKGDTAGRIARQLSIGDAAGGIEC
jgi:hypothetical protein